MNPYISQDIIYHILCFKIQRMKLLFLSIFVLRILISQLKFHNTEYALFNIFMKMLFIDLKKYIYIIIILFHFFTNFV